MKLQDNIANEFDHFADNYTEDMIKCVPHYLQLITSLSECLPKNIIVKSILDLGCGNGNVTSQLLKSFPQAEFTLIDASSQMIDICKNRFDGHKMNFVESYFEDWNFPEDSYDIIAAGFSLHHLDSDKKQWIFPNIHKATDG